MVISAADAAEAVRDSAKSATDRFTEDNIFKFTPI
jgi:hypothetical protein